MLSVLVAILFGTHVLIGMMPSAEFVVQVVGTPDGCEFTENMESDSLGILGFYTTCTAGTVSIWLADTGIDLPWWSEVVPWAVLWFPLWW